MLEYPSIRRYSLIDAMSSDNLIGADNQQETAPAGSSETVRQAPSGYAARIGDETVRSSWRREESGRNDLARFATTGHELSNNNA